MLCLVPVNFTYMLRSNLAGMGVIIWLPSANIAPLISESQTIAPGVGVTKPNSSVPLFSEIFSIV